MGGGKGGGTTSKTTVEPSPLAQVQAQYAQQIAPEIMSIVMGGLKGKPTPQAIRGAQIGGEQMMEQAGRMGIAPGDPRLMDQWRQISENLTKPNLDLLGVATQLYTGAPQIGWKLG